MKKFNHNFYEKYKFNLVSVYKAVTLYYAISTNNRTTFASPNSVIREDRRFLSHG